ncbi:MAG: DUF5916 domain-containing protein [Rubrivivax sp.]
MRPACSKHKTLQKRFSRQWIAAAALTLACLAGAHAQTAAEDTSRTVTAVRLQPGESIMLDGSLAHPAWLRAPAWDRFVEKEPRNGAEPPQRTRVQVLFDDRALYVGVTAFDSAPAHIRDLPVRYDQVNRTQDFVVVYVDPIGSKRSAQFFRVNAAGSMGDGLHTASDDSEDFSPDFDWDSAVQRTNEGWTAVLRLPFASLRYDAGGQQAWRIMVARRLPRDDFHLITSMPVPRDAPSFIHNLQPLAGVTLPRDSQFLTLRPSLTLRTTREQDTGQPRQVRSELAASLDLKWRPRAELVVDATLNPDFSQVALDVPQLAGNSRFALFFPEKRPFFFESADLLKTPTDALYTRSFTAPRWGVRGTWRASSLAGTALAVDDRGGGLVLLPGPYGTDFAEQPASRNVASRLRYDQGAFTLGGVVATRRYAQDAGDNTVLGPDASWQIDDTWRVRGQWLHAETSAQADGNGGLQRGIARTGQRRVLKFLRNADFSESNIGIDDIDGGFRNDSGFVNQVGVRLVTAFHSVGWDKVGPFNLFFLNLQAERITDRATGKVVKELIRPGWWSAGKSNLEWWFEAYLHSNVRTAADAPLLRERYVSSSLIMTPAPWWPLVDTNISLGRLADATANKVRSGGRWNFSSRFRPLRPLELEPSISLAWLDQGGQRLYHETAAQLLAVWHLGPAMNLRAILQRRSLDRRAEPGVSAVRDAGGANSLTWTWRRSAGTVLYVGAGTGRNGDPTAKRGSEAFVKLQFDVDEARAMW